MQHARRSGARLLTVPWARAVPAADRLARESPLAVADLPPRAAGRDGCRRLGGSRDPLGRGRRRDRLADALAGRLGSR